MFEIPPVEIGEMVTCHRISKLELQTENYGSFAGAGAAD